ncbi:MAG TPA: hypothetical protein VKU01_30060 [Bryobacteraceae bacterium]|nr:hypothetical protein [Bryobacteraceae bacterium]
MTRRKQAAAIFVNRPSQQWIVRDPDGNFWVVPVIDHPWQHRQPLELTDEIDLVPVPGHYRYLLELPF